MIKTRVSFVKLFDKWFVHIPDFPGEVEELEMVEGADDLCDKIDTDKRGVITIEITDFRPATYDWVLDFLEGVDPGSHTGGAYYGVTSFDNMECFNIWLCDVTCYVLGSHQRVLYIKKVE